MDDKITNKSFNVDQGYNITEFLFAVASIRRSVALDIEAFQREIVDFKMIDHDSFVQAADITRDTRIT